MASMQHVFDILELREQIFRCVGQRDLIVNVQRTCRRWRDTVLTLPETYLNTVPAVPAPKDDDHQPQLQQFNPLLLHHFRPFFPARNAELNYYIKEAVCLDLAKGFYESLCPLPTPNHRNLFTMSIAQRGDVHRAFARPGASWRRMQLASPPIKTLHYTGSSDKKKTVYCDDGLRMGPLYDLLIEGGVTDISSDSYKLMYISWANTEQAAKDEQRWSSDAEEEEEEEDLEWWLYTGLSDDEVNLKRMQQEGIYGNVEEVTLVKSYGQLHPFYRKHKSYVMEIWMNANKKRLMRDGRNEMEFIVRP